MNASVPPVRDLVLAGGGHAHVQVVKHFAQYGPPDLRVTLISEGATAFYSGMLPGCVARLYKPSDIQIELRPLCRWAGARFIEARITGFDHKLKTVKLAGRPDISYDVVSINLGSETRGTEVPGVREHALLTRPISRLLTQLDKFNGDNSLWNSPPRIAVVGGGAAGVELACGLRARFDRGAGASVVTLVDANTELLRNRGLWSRRLARKTLAELNINVLLGTPAKSVEAHRLYLEDGRIVEFDLLVWATGGAAPQLFNESGMATDENGFLKVRPTLQSVTSPDIFGAGDCINLEGYPSLAKSGVYAVREGPVLARNLAAYLHGERLESYTPQRGFLALLMTGDGRAIASWKSLAARGRWVWRWKDRIDRRFMDMFVPEKIRDQMGNMPMRSGAPLGKESESVAMRCAGCGGKVGGTVLSKTLQNLTICTHSRVRVGLEKPDDAAVIEVPADMDTVQTVDHFRAFLDDPYLIGRIAAVHAMSDVYAMGAMADTVLAFATLPYASEELTRRDLSALMAGVVHETNEAGVPLVGGHTSEGAELSVGLVVNGLIERGKALTKSGLLPGDRLILTKPLGTGCILAAEMRARPVGAAVDAAIECMLRSNASASSILLANGAHAMTDVTGFGLAVHLAEMLDASRVSATIQLSQVPLIPGAEQCLKEGILSSIHPSNLKHLLNRWTVQGHTQPGAEILFDPQTSGGLLAGVPAEEAAITLSQLHDAGYTSAHDIGEVISGEKTLIVK